ncbi:DUF177 domain-containing protein [Pelomonas sp. KK5]|uniref:YceD family protein n=1 Tax=Pelomonas sp. KK5 TaxID=1855730 RepID=UPI00097C41A8|nr:YceD family protein [Pelomonas sp. KK5]
MKKRVFVPEKLDVENFVKDEAELAGAWPAASLERLADAAAPEQPATGWPAVNWSLKGELREQRRAEPQLWMQVEADAEVQLTCQRCLKPVPERVEVSRWFHFVGTEDEAATLDADSEDDVLALPRHLDARELIEDELLLGLPLVPRHEECPEPLAAPAESDEEEEPFDERPNPFAKLAALKKEPGGTS